MKSFVIPLEQTIYGRITKAKLNKNETDIRLFILEHFRTEGKAPSMKKMITSIPNMSMFQVLPILEKLHSNDIIQLQDNKILLSYPYSHSPTNFKVEFMEDHIHCYALCATDALGIPCMCNEDVIIRSQCPVCKSDIKIAIENIQAIDIDPETVVKYVPVSENTGKSVHNKCSFIHFFCSEEHAKAWITKNNEYSKGEIYSIEEGLEHGREIFGHLLLSL